MGLSVFNYDCPGQLSLFDLETVPYKITKPIRLIELFAGIGSQAMALRNIGADFEHYRVVEFDKYAIASYNAIHETDFEASDITKISGSDLGIEDKEKYCYIMTYSFPCQDLSIAGKMAGMDKGSGTRSGLLWEVERLLNETPELPQVLLMENVPQVHGKGNTDNFRKWMNCLEWMGYKNYWQDLNAKNYGIPQNRKRCFMISILGDYSYEFPKPIKLEKMAEDYLEDEVPDKYKLGGERIQILLDNAVDNGTILTDRQTDRQTDRLSTCAYKSRKHYKYQTVSQQGKEDVATESRKVWESSVIGVGDIRLDEGVRIRKEMIVPCITCKYDYGNCDIVYEVRNDTHKTSNQ